MIETYLFVHWFSLFCDRNLSVCSEFFYSSVIETNLFSCWFSLLYVVADFSADTFVTVLLLFLIPPLCIFLWYFHCYVGITHLFFLSVADLYADNSVTVLFLCLIVPMCIFLWCFYSFLGVIFVVLGGCYNNWQITGIYTHSNWWNATRVMT